MQLRLSWNSLCKSGCSPTQEIHLPQLPGSWDYRCVIPCLAKNLFLIKYGWNTDSILEAEIFPQFWIAYSFCLCVVYNCTHVYMDAEARRGSCFFFIAFCFISLRNGLSLNLELAINWLDGWSASLKDNPISPYLPQPHWC